jgi:hydroxymethylbilane synthase
MDQLRIGSRGSALARAQAGQVARLLHACDPRCEPQITVIAVSGDGGDVPPQDKHRWVDAIEQALLEQRIDLAVHSAKDVPGEGVAGLELAGAPPRERAEDVLCGMSSLRALERGARVGTSSVRRCAQLRAVREDLDVVALSGNVDTRLAKLARAEVDAIVLAHAGLTRLGRQDAIGEVLDPATFVPAPGQGILALQTRAGDEHACGLARAVTDPDTLACLHAERALARALGADCDTPLGAHASAGADGALRLRAWVGERDGSAWICDELLGHLGEPHELGRELAARMTAVGAGELLAGVR